MKMFSVLSIMFFTCHLFLAFSPDDSPNIFCTDGNAV